MGDVPMHNLVLRLPDTPEVIRTPAFDLGQDNAQIFADIGFGRDDAGKPQRKGVM